MSMMAGREEFQRLKHFIWDFDGTLFDTYPIIIRNLRSALQEFGFDADPVEMMGLMLDTIPAARNHYADRFGIDREALAEVYQKYHLQATAQLEAQPMAGVCRFLDAVLERGGRHYVFTNRKVTETQAYLCKYGLLEYFTQIVGPETPGFAWKPAPDAIYLLLEQYGLNPEETVMVGDREIDLGSGRNAGVGTMHVVCTAVPEDLACDWRIENFEQALAMLE